MSRLPWNHDNFDAIVQERIKNPLIDGGKMTIAVFLAHSPWGEIDDQAMGKGLGGRETALVCLCIEWARLGHDVYAFVPRANIDIIENEQSGGKVRWIPNQATVEITEAVQPDLFVSWEDAEILDALTNYEGMTAIEMQVAHLETAPETQDLDAIADFVCVLSEWAKDFFLSQYPSFPRDRVLVFANGVYLSRFVNEIETPAGIVGESLASDFHFIYSSSPDRGLHHLLKMWPKIQDMMMSLYETECHLHICYGVENFVQSSRWSHREDANRALAIEELIEQQGVIYHGKVGQDTLAGLMMSCDLMLYPADTMSPTETGCISIVEALAAGAPVVTTDCDCIGPDYKGITLQTPLPFDEDEYLKLIDAALDPEDYQARVEAGQDFALGRDWPVIAAQWTSHFYGMKQSLSAA